eukprot:CAMPEP_0170927152 /NCGR_PEP_ID=MMETSP0735-20130129/13327_1 /TAXON_ID=186038 /ORGANISM="Fragilariopsis kerguelensis, Strain L26-C5" /LENGTH=120 /DNA_ID=CAMNT_0011327605 /DNA_START=29 /DNA_END=391 /DNA_ORIENTATION=-
MAPFTSNYETIKETSLKDKSVDPARISGDMATPNQGKSQSTFLQSVLSNKFIGVLVVVVLGTYLMAYNAIPVPFSNQFRLGEYAAIVDGSNGGRITDPESKNLGGNCFCNIILCCWVPSF